MNQLCATLVTRDAKKIYIIFKVAIEGCCKVPLEVRWSRFIDMVTALPDRPADKTVKWRLDSI